VDMSCIGWIYYWGAGLLGRGCIVEAIPCRRCLLNSVECTNALSFHDCWSWSSPTQLIIVLVHLLDEWNREK
jgi:hypothetical protein